MLCAPAHRSRSEHRTIDPHALKIPAPKGRNLHQRRTPVLHFTLSQNSLEMRRESKKSPRSPSGCSSGCSASFLSLGRETIKYSWHSLFREFYTRDRSHLGRKGAFGLRSLIRKRNQTNQLQTKLLTSGPGSRKFASGVPDDFRAINSGWESGPACSVTFMSLDTVC